MTMAMTWIWTGMVVQSWYNIYQLFMMGAVLMLLWWPKRQASTPFRWDWCIILISIFLSAADFVYFYALSLDGAMISIVSMVRRGSVIVSFIFGAMVFRAIDNEWLVKDPFRRYEYKEEETTREFLSKEEIHLLMETPITRKKMSMVRDLFLFCCFTGLAFIDLYNLKEENIKEFFDEGEWIVIHRQKTGTEANIKLLDYPKQIMEKYRGLCEDGRVFPVPNYQSCMDSLKRLGKKCGITKPLSWHMSRHSFATSVCLSNGVPIETVSSMLGHKDIKTTQVYAKITKEKLSKDVEKLSQQINNIEEFTFGNVCNDNTNTINGRV